MERVLFLCALGIYNIHMLQAQLALVCTRIINLTLVFLILITIIR